MFCPELEIYRLYRLLHVAATISFVCVLIDFHLQSMHMRSSQAEYKKREIKSAKDSQETEQLNQVTYYTSLDSELPQL
jgi:hypothetical protein